MQSGYEYCWRNFLSAQTLKSIDSLRKQFFFLLKDTGLVDHHTETCNTWSHDEHLVRAVICAGLFPGICSVVVSHYAFLIMFLYFLFCKCFIRMKRNYLVCRSSLFFSVYIIRRKGVICSTEQECDRRCCNLHI